MLEIQDLSCGYAGFALRNINITIKSGDLVGVIGPNGSGKTTLLRAITKVIHPTKGRILFEGKDIDKLPIKELARQIAVVSRPSDSEPRMSVEEFVLLGRIPHRQGFEFFERKKDLEMAEKAMVETDVLRLKERSVDSLSSGEMQLVFIARALAQEPRLLLLDEPTSHLDITHQVRVLDLLRRLNRETALTVMIVLHDLNLAGQYCDRLVLLSGGSVHKDDSPKEVLTYQIIEEVYKTVVVVLENPVTAKPNVFLISADQGKRIAP